MYYRKRKFDLKELLSYEPTAMAVIRGNSTFSEINGSVNFYQAADGVLVVAEIFGLPVGNERCSNDIFAFHIHSGATCSGNAEDEFADTGTHYNPNDCPHPYHAGDMPSLFSAEKRAFLAFLTERFTVDEIIGKTVIIHHRPDDLTTQPSGNAGNKIACGEIVVVQK
nr:superoxide dismutase family protein [Oscillospiraceae bacterium]